jgi:peptide/nickel transport system permease protein
MVFTPFWQDPWVNLSQLIWPALATGYRYSAVATRMTRSAVLEVLREDYIRTARAKGLDELGKLLVDAVTNYDYTLVQALVLIVAFVCSRTSWRRTSSC